MSTQQRRPEKYWIGHLPHPKPITRAEAVNAIHEVFGVGTWLKMRRIALTADGLELGPRYDCNNLFARGDDHGKENA